MLQFFVYIKLLLAVAVYFVFTLRPFQLLPHCLVVFSRVDIISQSNEDLNIATMHAYT